MMNKFFLAALSQIVVTACVTENNSRVATGSESSGTIDTRVIESQLELEMKAAEILWNCAFDRTSEVKQPLNSQLDIINFTIEPCLPGYEEALSSSGLNISEHENIKARAIQVTVEGIGKLVSEQTAFRTNIKNRFDQYYRDQKACHARTAVDYKEIAVADFSLFLDAAKEICPWVESETIKGFGKTNLELDQIASALALLNVCAATTALTKLRITDAIPNHLLESCPEVDRKHSGLQQNMQLENGLQK